MDYKSLTKEELNICPVCGYDDLPEVPYDSYGFPTYVICPCCGYEFGFDDESKGISFSEYRDNWISNVFRFFNKKRKPKEWGETEMQRQLGNIKKVNYKSRIL